MAIDGKISVVLATYNGESYLEAQLESLRTQSVLPDQLVVSDDNSSDSSNQIVREFSRTAPFPVIHVVNEHRLGFADNFFRAVELSDGEWIFFCDQDDIWFPHKIEIVRHYMKVVNKPYMIAHSAQVVDKDLRVIAGKYIGGRLGGKRRGGRNSLWSVPPGFCQAVNRQTFSLDISDRPLGRVDRRQQMAHDLWTYFVASALGDICRIPQPLALYRRHAKTVTGYGREGEILNPSTLSRSTARYRFAHQYMDVCNEYADFWRVKATELSEEYRLKAEQAASLYTHAARFYQFRSEIHRPNNSRFGRVQAFSRLRKLCDPSLRTATEYSFKQQLLDLAAAFLSRSKMREQ